MEGIILKCLLENGDYFKKIVTFLKNDHIKKKENKLILKIIQDYFIKYKKQITEDVFYRELDEYDVEEDFKNKIKSNVERAKNTNIDVIGNLQYYIDKTEEYAQNVSIEKAILDSMEIIKDNKEKEKVSIPKILRDALAVSIDKHTGHDYFRNAYERFCFYNDHKDKIKSSLEAINLMTNGGFPNGSLSVFLSGTNIGKTLVLSHLASDFLMQNKNVLYITLEIKDMEIAQRVDQNLLDMTNYDIVKVQKKRYGSLLHSIKNKTKGSLKIKQFASSMTTIDGIESYMEELDSKLNWKPDVLIIDYLTLLRSNTLKNFDQLYTLGKFISEEVRGSAVLHDIPIVSAVQLNRGGSSKENSAEISDISDSWAIAQNVDWSCIISQTEELDQQNKYLFKVVKNRFDVLIKGKNRALVGVDKYKQRLFNLDDMIDGVAEAIGQKKEKQDMNEKFNTFKV